MNRLTPLPMLAPLILSLPLTGCLQNDVDLGGSALPVTYRGYIEGRQFASGSDAIEIYLDSKQLGPATGTVRFGAAPDLPPATDPDTAYPPGVVDFDSYRPAEGFDFTVQDGALAADRLQLHVYIDELWSDWCELQTDAFDPGGCGNSGHWESGNGAQCGVGEVIVDCGKVKTCKACDCTPYEGCVFRTTRTVRFDLNLSGNQAHGSAMGLTDLNHPLHVWLKRVPD